MIDVHAHYLPDFYRDALVAAGQAQPDGIQRLPDWSEASALAMMDALGINTAMLSISSPGVHFGDDAAAARLSRQLNEEGARLVKAYPSRFGLFAVLPLPDVERSIAEAEYALDVLKADGVVLETNHHGVYLGDQRLDPLYAMLDARRAVIFIHPTSSSCACCDGLALGYPRPVLEFMFETTRSVVNMMLSGALDRHQALRVIVPHAGATLPVLADRVAMLMPALGSGNGMSSQHIFDLLRRLHYDLAGMPVPRLLGALLQIADPAKILYGSDGPFTPLPLIQSLLDQLQSTPLLNDDVRRLVFTGNAQILFPRLGPE
jgi:predicted TIM-barrel fold metal-dependent hydrolase